MNKIKNLITEVEKLTEDKIALASREKEILDQLEEAKKEREIRKEEAKSSIDNVCGDAYFCGVVLSDEDLASLFKVAIGKKPGASIRIPYQLYENEEQELPAPEVSELSEEKNSENNI